MMNFLLKLILKLIPKEYREYIDLATRIFQRLDTAAERRDAVMFLINAQTDDGYISVPEWTQWGSKLGIIGKQKKAKAQEPVVAHTV